MAAAMDRHVYAWDAGGAPVAGFPALVVDRSKVAGIDPATHQVTFNEQAGESLMQGAIVNTPAVGDLTGDGRPEIVVGTNEEYDVDAPGEGGLNADNVELRALEQAAAGTGVLSPAHSRVYALAADGSVLEGWPAKIGKLTAELLPIVGEGITGSPVIGPAECAGPGGVASAPSRTQGSATCCGLTATRASAAARTARTAWSTRCRPRAPSRTRRPSRPWATRRSATSAEACRSCRRRRACGGRSTPP